MATVSIKRPRYFNLSEKRYEQSVLVKNSEGLLVSETQILETINFPAISDSASIESGASMVVESLTSLIEDSKTTYSLSSQYIKASLSVYLNGVNVTEDITSKSINGFSLKTEYQDVIKSDNGQNIIAIYTKKG